LTSLVKKLDETLNKSSSKCGSFVVMLTDAPEEMETSLKSLAEKEGLKKVVLTIDNPQGPPNYKIAKEADVTVVLYKGRKVTKTFAFEKGKLTEKEVAELTAAMADMIKK
jgi:uncharacterized lipoprotein YmbA